MRGRSLAFLALLALLLLAALRATGAVGAPGHDADPTSAPLAVDEAASNASLPGPTALVLGALSLDSAVFHWTNPGWAVTNLTVYVGYSCAPWFHEISVGNATSAEITGLDPNSVYCAQVRAWSGSTQSSPSNNLTFSPADARYVPPVMSPNGTRSRPANNTTTAPSPGVAVHLPLPTWGFLFVGLGLFGVGVVVDWLCARSVTRWALLGTVVAVVGLVVALAAAFAAAFVQ